MEADREQWDDGNNVLAVEPGVVVGYDRNVDTNTKLRRAGHRGDHDRGLRAVARSWRRALHELPARPRRGVGARRCWSSPPSAAMRCCAGASRSKPRSRSATRRSRPRALADDRARAPARRHARQRSADRPARAPERGVPRRAQLPARRARRRERGHDRLPPRARARATRCRERHVASLLTQTVVDALDPAFRKPDEADRPGVRRRRRRRRSRASGAGRSRPTATVGAAWSRRPSRARSSSCRRSSCCSSTTCSSCARAAAVCPSSSTPTARGTASRPSSTRTRRRALLARQLGADLLLLLTDVPAVEVGLGDCRMPARSARITARELQRDPVRGRLDGPEGRGGGGVRHGRPAPGRRSARSATRRPWSPEPAGTQVVADRLIAPCGE